MCGVIGVVSSRQADAAPLAYAGLWSLQHRGQESAGIVTYGLRDYQEQRGMGTVDAMFRDSDLEAMKGTSAIGHVRYSTAGASTSCNIQPIQGSFQGIPFWLAHNGNLLRYEERRRELAERGYLFNTTTDTEFIAALIHCSAKDSFEEALLEALASVEGTYSIVALYKEQIFGVRDPSGNRPLVIGAGNGITVIASESVACDVLTIKTLRDVEPGEMIVIDPLVNNWYNIHGEKPSPAGKRFCIFEFVYFLRPDSMFMGHRAQATREQMGRFLWKEHQVDADVVVAVPDSGNYCALGISKESGLPLESGIFRSHYVGRTFIEPLGKKRAQSLNIKFNVIPELVRGKRVVLVDDSIVRASVIKKVIGLLREAGVAQVHVLISSPPYLNPCYYGIDTYRVEGELIARRLNGNVEAIRREIGADSLGYLSLEKLKEAVAGDGPRDFCDACFSGDYPIPIQIKPAV